MAADVTSSVRSGPGGVNFWVQARSCGLVMTTTLNLQHARRYSYTLLLSVCTGASPASDLHSLRRSPPQPGLALVACRVNFISIRTISASAH